MGPLGKAVLCPGHRVRNRRNIGLIRIGFDQPCTSLLHQLFVLGTVISRQATHADHPHQSLPFHVPRPS